MNVSHACQATCCADRRGRFLDPSVNAAQMIEEAGFIVIEAANSDEAIMILESRLDITVVFADIQMPGSMDGLKLAAAIRGRWPPIQIIATSGLIDVRKGDLPNGGRFLPKPYSPAQIIGALREVTDGFLASLSISTMRCCLT